MTQKRRPKMISIQKAKGHFIHQGAEAALLTDIIKTLQAANLLPVHEDIPMSAREITSLLIGSTAPDSAKAADYVTSYFHLPGESQTFGEVIRSIFQVEPANLNITSIRICPDLPAAWIYGTNGDVLEFLAEDFQG